MRRPNLRDVLTLILLTLVLGWLMLLLFHPASAETRWIMCGDFSYVRETASKKGQIGGRLDVGDEFETDEKTRNGFIRVIGIGEANVGWVFKGYTVTEEPVRVDDRYVCVANNRVACRRWIDGPQFKGKTGWLYNGTTVMVYWRTSEWSVTSRGYIRSEWLDPAPE